MFNKIRYSLFTLISIFFLCTASMASEINFRQGAWDEILEIARDQDKIIFVDAYATWCGPCKEMTKYVFTDDSVSAFFNSNFINYKLDMETGEGEIFGGRYDVTAYPTLYFIHPDGTVARKKAGYHDKEEFLQLGRDVLYPELSDLHQYTERYAGGERDTAFLYDYLMELYSNEMDYSTPLEDYWARIDTSMLSSAKPFVIFYLMEEDIYQPQTRYFINNYEEFVFLYGEYAENKLAYIIDSNITAAKEEGRKERVDMLITALQVAFTEEGVKQLEDEIMHIYNAE